MFGGKELQYPVDWHFRIITENAAHPEVVRQIRQVLADFNIQNPLNIGNESAAAKYVSYQVTVNLASRKFMEDISAAFSAIPGVKMVL
jgi:putative lipoic acid-binding regulatory protein